MKTTAVATTLSLLAALLFALSLALACGDDDGGSNPTGSNGDGDTLPGYFAAFQRISEDADNATKEAEEQLNDADSGTPLGERLSTFDAYLAERDTIVSETIDRLKGLSVPASAAGDHQDFIDGVRESVDVLNALRNDLTGITTDGQMNDRLARFDSDIDAAVDKADAACLALQTIADTEEIAIDLAC